jgi:hypothetical protein
VGIVPSRVGTARFRCVTHALFGYVIVKLSPSRRVRQLISGSRSPLSRAPAHGAQERGISASTAGPAARLTRAAISANRPRPLSNTRSRPGMETFVAAQLQTVGYARVVARSSALMSLLSVSGVLGRGVRGWLELRRSGPVCVCGVTCRV